MTAISDGLGGPHSFADVLTLFKSTKPEALPELVSQLLSSEELTNRFSTFVISELPTIIRDVHINPAYDSVRGALLFFIFHAIAVYSEGAPASSVFLHEIPRQSDFVIFLCTFHEIPESTKLSRLAYHTCGTSSIIFTAATSLSDPCVLKIIQAQYAGQEDIRAATAAYENKFPESSVKYAPRIFKSKKTWVIMEFIDGQNLHDYLRSIRKPDLFLSERYVSLVSNIFIMITDALSYYHRDRKMIHGDLTPYNVMIVTDDDNVTPREIKLIDFGPNYVLRNRVGSRQTFAETFARTELFSAPEVTREQQEPSYQSDFYSLGMIGLDLLSPKPLRSEDIAIRLEEIWKHPATVGVAQIIEDLVDDKPNYRGLVLRTSELHFETLREAFLSQVNLYHELIAQQKESIWRSFDVTPEIKRSISTVQGMWKAEDTPYKTTNRAIVDFAKLNAGLWKAIFYAFVICTGLDIIVFFGDRIPSFITTEPHVRDGIDIIKRYTYIIPGQLRENLPGRLVALTFGFVASRYYANIFASLRVVDFDHPMKNITNFVLRANSCSYFPFIMVAIIFNPNFWPYCSFVGTFITAINNFCCHYCAKASADRSNIFTMERYHQAQTTWFLKEFRGWWRLMFWYSVGILSVGCLLSSGYAADGWVYAGAFCIQNILQLYLNSCRRDAPLVLGNLSRLFFSLRRYTILVRQETASNLRSRGGRNRFEEFGSGESQSLIDGTKPVHCASY